MSGEYSYNGVQIKLEKLSEVERSTIEDSYADVENEVEVLPTPVKIEVIVSLDDDEGPPGPGHAHNYCPDTHKDNNDVTNQIKNEEVDVGGGPSNKKQKLMINKTSVSSSCSAKYNNSTANQEVSSSSTLDLNDTPLLMIRQDGNSDSSNNNDENIDEFGRGSPMDILEPSTSSSISIPTPVTNNSSDNSKYHVTVVDGKIVFDVKSQEELNKKIETLVKLPDTSLVKIIEIQSNPEDNLYIGYKQFKALYSMSFPQLEALNIGLNFHENITAKLFEDFLVKFGENLVHFHVTGGYIGLKKEEILVRIPPLPKLEHFAFQSIYNFDTSDEIIEPVKVQLVQDDDGVDLLVLDDEIAQKEAEIPTSNELFKITVFLPRLKCLKEIILGNYIKVITSDPLKSTVEEEEEEKRDEFSFEYFKKLEVFKVGSSWNEIVHFLPAKYYKVVLKEIQFPDLLNDPSILSKIVEIFPKLESVHLNLPSPFVLQQFIQIFAQLELKKVHLRTAFLFEGTDVKILCGLYRAREGEEERKIAWFGSHGNLDGFEKSEFERELQIAVNNNQKCGKNLRKRKCPPKPGKLLGLGSLKSLTTFYLFHLPRNVYFSKYAKTLGFDYLNEKFPPQDTLAHFIKELDKIKNIDDSFFPQVSKAFAKYLAERFRDSSDAFDEIYPNLLKVDKSDTGEKVKSEVKQENEKS